VSSTLADDPFPSNYNLFLLLTSADIPNEGGTFGFSFSSADFDLSNYAAIAIAAAGSAVPEPMSFGLLVLGGVGFLVQRRR
jgi:hypothetical protein